MDALVDQDSTTREMTVTIVVRWKIAMGSLKPRVRRETKLSSIDNERRKGKEEEEKEEEAG